MATGPPADMGALGLSGSVCACHRGGTSGRAVSVRALVVSRRSSLRAGNQAFYPLSNKVLVLISLGGFHTVRRV